MDPTIDRSKGLGASEVGCVVGMGFKGAGPNKLWKQKTNRRAAVKETKAMLCGTILEPYIREMAKGELKRAFPQHKDIDIIEVPEWEPDPQNHWRRRSLDGVCPSLKANVQIKTSSTPDKWGDNWSPDVSDYVKPQLVQEMSWVVDRVDPGVAPFTLGVETVSLPTFRSLAWEDDSLVDPGLRLEKSFVPVLMIPSPGWQSWNDVIDIQRSILKKEKGAQMAMLKFIDRCDLRVFEVLRDEEKERVLFEQAARFWDYVEADKEPPEDFVDEAAKEVLLR